MRAIGSRQDICLPSGSCPIMSPFWVALPTRKRPIDLERMRSCARLFIGEHDWTAFSAAQSDAESRVRKITNLGISARLGRSRPLSSD